MSQQSHRRKLWIVVFPSLALAGCNLSGPSAAQLEAAADAKCQSYGAHIGSDAYVRCRMALDQQHAALVASDQPTPIVVAPPPHLTVTQSQPRNCISNAVGSSLYTSCY